MARHLNAVLATAVLAATLAGCATKEEPLKADPKTISKLYEEAREEQANGTYERAIRIYEQLEGLASGSLLAQQAQLERAYLLYKTGEPAQALALTERFLKYHPTSPAADYAYYLQGLINFNDELGIFGRLSRQDLSERDQQAARDAYDSFKQLVDRFPESRYAPDAKQRMNYIVNALASYEVHVARYYYKRGAYVAAANRAQQALQDFRNVPSTEEALYIMAASYDRLGLNDLRDDAVRVLGKNFPQSEWLGRIGADVDTKKRWWHLW